MPDLVVNPPSTLTLDIVNEGVTIEVPSLGAMTLTLDVAQGPSGSNISNYAVRIDQVDASTIYRGEAAPGSAEGSSSWRLQKVVISGEDITITWAGGNANFNKIWTDRLSYSYS